MEKLIIYKNIIGKAEICRDRDCLFIPQINNLVRLGEFPINRCNSKSEIYLVRTILIGYDVMEVFVSLVVDEKKIKEKD